MTKKLSGLDLLEKNFNNVEGKFLDFFEKEEPRWPSDARDYLRNHHQSLGQFFPATISWEKLRFHDLPDNILLEAHAAFDAFLRGEEYN